MKHTKLTTLLATLAIATSTGAFIAPTHPVQASKLSTIKSTTGYRKVRLLKNVNVRKIHWRTPLYKSTLGSKQYVAKGEVVSIKWSGTNFGWYMKVPGHSGEYTISKKLNDTSWFTFNTKNSFSNTANGFKGKSFTSGNIKVTFNKAYNVKIKDPENNKKTTRVVFTGTITNHSKKGIAPDFWIEDHFGFFNNTNKEIFPAGLNFAEDADYKFSELLNESLVTLKAGKSRKFALSTDIVNSDKTKPTSKYIIKAHKGTTKAYLPVSLTLHATNDSYTGEIMW